MSTDLIREVLNNSSIDIDNRPNKLLTQSIIDRLVNDIRLVVRDDSVGEQLVAKALKYLGEGQVRNIADYAARKADFPGRAFVKICSNELNKKSIQ